MSKFIEDWRRKQEDEESEANRPNPQEVVKHASKTKNGAAVSLDETFVAPDIVGTVEGWRTWQIDLEVPPFGNAVKLYSATHGNFFWAPRTLARAECPRNPDHVPGENCTCGFYSAKTLRHLQSMGYIQETRHGKTWVVGRLANWGKVIEGSQGWRSELAYPVMLYVPFEAWKLAKPLSDAYGVPVKLFNVLDQKIA